MSQFQRHIEMKNTRQQNVGLSSTRHALARRIRRVFTRMSPIVYPRHSNTLKTVTAAGVCTPLKGHQDGKQARFIRQHFTNNIFANLYRESGLQHLGCSPHHRHSPQEKWRSYDNTSLDISQTYEAWKYCANGEMR